MHATHAGTGTEWAMDVAHAGGGEAAHTPIAPVAAFTIAPFTATPIAAFTPNAATPAGALPTAHPDLELPPTKYDS